MIRRKYEFQNDKPRNDELAHHGVKGMHWYKHKFGEIQEQAKYADKPEYKYQVSEEAKKIAAGEKTKSSSTKAEAVTFGGGASGSTTEKEKKEKKTEVEKLEAEVEKLKKQLAAAQQKSSGGSSGKKSSGSGSSSSGKQTAKPATSEAGVIQNELSKKEKALANYRKYEATVVADRVAARNKEAYEKELKFQKILDKYGIDDPRTFTKSLEAEESKTETHNTPLTKKEKETKKKKKR